MEDERVRLLTNVALLSCSSLSVRPDSLPGAEDKAPTVLGGASGMRNMEGGLLPERGLVRLVHGTRDRVGGRLAARLRVGPYFNSPCTVRSGASYVSVLVDVFFQSSIH